MSLPDAAARTKIFTKLLKDRGLSSDDFAQLSSSTAGYSGSDIASLCKEVAMRSALIPAAHADLPLWHTNAHLPVLECTHMSEMAMAADLSMFWRLVLSTQLLSVQKLICQQDHETPAHTQVCILPTINFVMFA